MTITRPTQIARTTRLILFLLAITACAPGAEPTPVDAAPASTDGGGEADLACSFSDDTGCLACCHASRCCVVCAAGPAVCGG